MKKKIYTSQNYKLVGLDQSVEEKCLVILLKI